MVAGVACVITALTILLGPSVFRIAEWTQYHAITVSVVFVTIAFLHLRAEAWGAGHKLAAFGFVFLAIVGTSLIVGQSVGRQAEATGATMMSASDLNARIAAKSADLASAKDRLKNAQRMADKEMTGQRCKDRCKAWQENAIDISNAVRQLEGDLAALGPQRPVNAKAEKIADLLAIFGVAHSAAVAFWTLAEPFALTLLFEFGSVISFSYAFPHRSIVKPTVSIASTETMFSEAKLKALETVDVSPLAGLFSGELPDPTPPKPRKRKGKPETAKVIQFPARHPVIEALDKAGGSVSSNRQLANLMGVTEGESTKRVQEVAGMVSIEKHGKQIKISLRKIA